MRPARMNDGGHRMPNAIGTRTVPNMRTTTPNTHPAAACQRGIHGTEMKRPAGFDTRGPFYSVYRVNRSLPTNRMALTSRGQYPCLSPLTEAYTRYRPIPKPNLI